MLCSNFTRIPAYSRCRSLSAFGFYVIRRNDLARGNKDAHVCPVGSSSVSVAIKISSSTVVSGFSPASCVLPPTRAGSCCDSGWTSSSGDFTRSVGNTNINPSLVEFCAGTPPPSTDSAVVVFWSCSCTNTIGREALVLPFGCRFFSCCGVVRGAWVKLGGATVPVSHLRPQFYHFGPRKFYILSITSHILTPLGTLL